MTEVQAGLCHGCKHVREYTLVDSMQRGYCVDCAPSHPATRELLLANWVAGTMPYQVGDRVSCKTGASVYDGIGRIEEISTDLKDLATPLVPMFRVAIEEKAYPEVPDEVWYSEACMARVDA